MTVASAPFPLLVEFLPHVNRETALDIGAGDGRNSIFLAQKGFLVEAIDIDRASIESIRRISLEEELNITAEEIDMRQFKFLVGHYDLILAIQSLCFVRKSEFKNIVERIKNALKPGGWR